MKEHHSKFVIYRWHGFKGKLSSFFLFFTPNMISIYMIDHGL